MPAWLLIVPVIAVLPGWIGYHKGHGFWYGWIFGLLLWPVAVAYILFFMHDVRPRCPSCAELVRPEAVVCPHCQRPITDEDRLARA